MENTYTKRAVELLTAYRQEGHELSRQLAAAVLAYGFIADRRGIEAADRIVYGPGGLLEDHRETV